eukprot:6796285-Alexandrium_andersonii.AAC.1
MPFGHHPCQGRHVPWQRALREAGPGVQPALGHLQRSLPGALLLGGQHQPAYGGVVQQAGRRSACSWAGRPPTWMTRTPPRACSPTSNEPWGCLLYTSDAADDM